ncbi:hypothetical protein ACF0H5_017761 [Mactra antiquata]
MGSDADVKVLNSINFESAIVIEQDHKEQLNTDGDDREINFQPNKNNLLIKDGGEQNNFHIKDGGEQNIDKSADGSQDHINEKDDEIGKSIDPTNDIFHGHPRNIHGLLNRTKEIENS